MKLKEGLELADIKRALDTVGHMEKLLDVGNEIHATSNVPLGKYAENDFRPIKIDEEGRVYIDTAALNAIKLLLGEAVDYPEAYTALARLKSLEDKIAAIIAGTSPATVQLYGSIPEFGWVDGDTEPTPDSFAFGAKVNPSTGEITTMYWNGTSWEEVR